MNVTSRVAVLTAPRRIELRREGIPDPPDGGIVVRVRAALTDGTDLKTYRRGHPKMPMPTRFGHEFSGDVAAVGRGASAFRVGDAVMCVHTAPCGDCFWCVSQQEELCERLLARMLLGAYADYIVVPPHVVAQNCFLKPPDVSYAQAAFLEPVACVVHSVALLDRAPGSTVAVIGNGGFGILHALLLARNGVRALLVGRNEGRAALARDLGIETLAAGQSLGKDAIFECTQGRGADAAVDCTGVQAVWEALPDLVRRGGTVSFFGGLPGGARVSFSSGRLHYDEVRLMAPFHFSPRDVRVAYELIAAGGLPLLALISHAVALEEIAGAFARLDAGEGIKMLVEP